MVVRQSASGAWPHAIDGFEEADRVGALVLELVEDETLADRIARGSIPLRAVPSHSMMR